MRHLLILLAGLLGSGAAMGATVVINNVSDWDIHYLYLSPTYSNEWGPDQLGDEIIYSGSQFKLRKVSCDTYDVRIVDEDQDECIIPEVALCIFKENWQITNNYLLNCQNNTQGGGGVRSGGATGTMTLHNGSSWDIYELYISSSNQSNWGNDILGNDIWGSGRTVDVYNFDCGNYDIRIVDEDSDVCELSSVYLCGAEGTVSLDNAALLGCQGY